MKVLEYKVTFTTPAFLGDAEQSGRWRTPPFKALLRQWWRVAHAADHGFPADVAAMRQEEGQLFGVASDGEGDSRKSLVRIRLSKWSEGTLGKAQWPADTTVFHPEVKNRQGQLVPVGSALYQGFGPLVYDGQRRTTTLKANAAIQAGDSATFSLAAPDDHLPRLERALSLMDRYGTLGGRSRNGWGSFSLSPDENTPALGGESPLRAWKDALSLDWPHAVGRDERGALVWQTKSFDDWKAAMKRLAEIKIGLRTKFAFRVDNAAGDRPMQRGINHGRPQERHWLSFPVTNHAVSSWGGNTRLPNSLRFKMRLDSNDPMRLVGVVFHVPCLPPAAFMPDLHAIESVWGRVHSFLDAPGQQLIRVPE